MTLLHKPSWVVLLVAMITGANGGTAATKDGRADIVWSNLTLATEEAPPRSALQRIARPVSRSAAVQALLASSQASAKLRSTLPTMGKLSALRTMTVAGTPVASAGLLGPPAETGGPPLPVGTEGINWAGGVHISPTRGAPFYAAERQNYPCATLGLRGITSSTSYTLSDMMRDGVTCHSYISSISLSLNLPGHSGLYVLTYRLETSEQRIFQTDNLRISATIGNADRSEQLSWSRSSDDGVVAVLLEIPAGTEPLDLSRIGSTRMEEISAVVVLSFDSFMRSVYLGGVTVTRL